MRRRMLSQMLNEQVARNMSAETKARLIQPINYSQLQNESAAFQGVAQSSPQGAVPPVPEAPIKRKPGRPRKVAQ